MQQYHVGILGFGKMQVDCAKVLIDNKQPISFILETEETSFSSIENLCNKNGIVFQRGNKSAISGFLRSLKAPTIILSINNNYLFPPDIVSAAHFRIVNFHGSFLPSYPGHGKVIPSWIIFNGETRHGATWHLVKKGIDSGNILCQEVIPVHENDTALQLSMRVISSGISLFVQNWASLISPLTKGTPQAEVKRRVYRGNDLPNNGFLDTTWDFFTMNRFLRSMDYGPYPIIPKPRVVMEGKEYTIDSYLAQKGTLNGTSGIVIDNKDSGSVEFMFPAGTIKIRIMNSLSGT